MVIVEFVLIACDGDVRGICGVKYLIDQRDDEFGNFCKHGTEDIVKDRVVRICQKDGPFYGKSMVLFCGGKGILALLPVSCNKLLYVIIG